MTAISTVDALRIDASRIDREAQLLELDRADCEQSLYLFFKSAWPFIDAASWVDGWCMQAIAEHLEAVCDGQVKRLLINISPRCSKSALCSIVFPAWVWAQAKAGPISGPGVPFLHASYANQLSLRDSVKCRRLIESTWYQARWGNRFALTSDQNTKSRFTNDRGGERLITSIDGTNTGEGGMCFVAGTGISTPNGQRAIETLQPGDAVFAFDIQQQRIVTSRIVATARRQAHELCTLYETSGHRTTCTSDHGIYSPGRGFVPAGEMGRGDRLLVAGNTLWRTGDLAHLERHRGRAVDVYDIQVEGQNNFFADGLLVHNCIVIDDPNSVDDVDSEANIQTVIDWWEGTMPTRLNSQDDGAYIVIQQRTFENDLTGHILETEVEDWCHLMIPMRYESVRSFFTPIGWKDPRTVDGELMWPERFSESAVSRLEKRLGSWRSSGQLQQRPEPAGGGIIKREWWQLWEGDKLPPRDFTIACLDTAFTEDEINDPSGMMVWGVFTQKVIDPATRFVGGHAHQHELLTTGHGAMGVAPKVLMCHAWEDRLTLHELVKRVVETCRSLKVDLLLIENKAAGISVAQEIRRLFADERYGVQFFDPKSQDKMARLISVQHLFEEGIIYAPSETYSWVERVISQVGMFPKGKHDEFVDLTSMGLRFLRGNGLIARQPEREREFEARKQYKPREQALYPA